MFIFNPVEYVWFEVWKLFFKRFKVVVRNLHGLATLQLQFLWEKKECLEAGSDAAVDRVVYVSATKPIDKA